MSGARRHFVGDEIPCRKCGTRLVVTPQRALRSNYYCVECKRAWNREWLRKNWDRKQETNARFWATLDPEVRRAYRLRQHQRAPEQRFARNAVNNALRAGTLVRKPCEVCGAVKSEGHHDDYSKPLEVRWLCRLHHTQHHKTLREK